MSGLSVMIKIANKITEFFFSSKNPTSENNRRKETFLSLYIAWDRGLRKKTYCNYTFHKFSSKFSKAV